MTATGKTGHKLGKATGEHWEGDVKLLPKWELLGPREHRVLQPLCQLLTVVVDVNRREMMGHWSVAVTTRV